MSPRFERWCRVDCRRATNRARNVRDKTMVDTECALCGMTIADHDDGRCWLAIPWTEV
jgi:hypothetical protein